MVASRESPSLAAFRYRVSGAPTARSLSVNVARYTQQAVLMANIEEARYQVLMSDDGKTLTLARYAVRNNQRNFVKIGLPPVQPSGAHLCQASPPNQVRPPMAVCYFHWRRRAERRHAVFVVEILYISKATTWTDKGKVKLTLPALDLPVSRTGLLLYYPPLFQVTADTGAFRTEAYSAPLSQLLVRLRPWYRHRHRW